MRVLLLDYLPEGVMVERDGEFKPLSASYLSIGSRFSLSSNQGLELFRELPDPEDPERPPIMTRVGVIDLPSSSGHYMIALWPNPRPEQIDQTILGKAFPEDAEAFPPASVNVINLSRGRIVARIDGDDGELEPATSKLFVPELNDRFRFRVQAAVQADGTWEVMQNGVATMQPGSRMYCIAVFDQRGMRHLYSETELAGRDDPPPTFFWLRIDDVPPPLPERN